MMTRGDLARELGVPRTTLHTQTRCEGSPKPDDYLMNGRGTWPLWHRDSLPAWRAWFDTHVRSSPHRTDGHAAGCRCSMRCKMTESERVNTYRKCRYASRVKIDGHWVHPEAPHGKASAYVNWGCHCPECRVAFKERYEGKAND